MRQRERIGWLAVIAAMLLVPAAGRGRHAPKPGAASDLTLILPLSASGALSDGRAVTVSGSLTVSIAALPVPPATTLTAGATTVARGAALKVSWTGLTSPTAKDWVGLFAPGTTNSDMNVKDWVYTNGMAAGTVSLPISPSRVPGAYELRLFRADGWVLAATGPMVTVTGTAPVPATGPHLSLSAPALDWGTFYLDKTHSWDDRMVTFTNDGGGTLSGSVGTISGNDFSYVVKPPGAFSLSTGQIEVLGLRFSPATAGAKSGTLSIQSNDPRSTVSVPLSGTATPLPAPAAALP